MNKKLLFAAMSLAALTACTDNDFESQKVAQQEATPVTFEVINNNDAFTRASMNGNKVAWSATDGDLFTLYHGAAALGAVSGYQNATYTAAAAEGSPAVLTTPSMILKGAAIMVWPADTAFNIGSGADLKITVPQEQPADIENYIPYVSEQIEIGDYNGVKALPNTAGYQREYPIYMRPMASQLNLKTDYAGTDETIAQLYDGGSACPADGGIEPISLTSVGLVADEGNKVLTIEVPVKFSDPGTGAGSIKQQWNDAVKNNAWGKITDFDKTNIAATGQVEQLSTKCIQGLDGCKLLILPLKNNLTGAEKSGVVVNTLYGKVIVAPNGAFTGAQYSADEIKDAWYRYLSAATAAATGETKATAAETSGDNAGKFKTTANIAAGMTQTLNGFSAYKATSGIVKGEPIGAAATRYVKVLLNYLDMSDLHIKTDKHLRDAALVWNHLKTGNVTIFLDGDKTTGEIEISQKTIKLINDLNAAAAKEDTPRKLTVKPCKVPGEVCKTIVITGASDIQNIQDLTFIVDNGGTKVDVALAADETWKWDAKNAVKVTAAAVNSIINKGTLQSDATATIKTTEADGTQNNVPFVNEGTWDISGNTTKLNVQFNVTNWGIVKIAAGAQYRQDGQTQNTEFINEAETLPARFLADPTKEKVGKVFNEGVFATNATSGNTAEIHNYGLIEHKSLAAKTYITTNEKGGNFASAFDKSTNKLGTINFPWSCKGAENVSISNALNTGFVSVTVDGEITSGKLEATGANGVGSKVNYVIIKSGITEINKVAGTVQYLEINEPGTEIAWKTSETNSYAGLVVFSDINITQGTRVQVTNSCFLAADMYVGGAIDNGTVGTLPNWAGYFGDTTAKFATNFLTY